VHLNFHLLGLLGKLTKLASLLLALTIVAEVFFVISVLKSLELFLHAGDCERSVLYNITCVTAYCEANIVRRPCSDSSHITAPYKLFYDYYY